MHPKIFLFASFISGSLNNINDIILKFADTEVFNSNYEIWSYTTMILERCLLFHES